MFSEICVDTDFNPSMKQRDSTDSTLTCVIEQRQ